MMKTWLAVVNLAERMKWRFFKFDGGTSFNIFIYFQLDGFSSRISILQMIFFTKLNSFLFERMNDGFTKYVM